MEIPIFTALVIGFIGSGHCLGMCGGIVGSLNSSLQKKERTTRPFQLPYHAMYNLGRVTSYSIAGGVAGLMGESAVNPSIYTAVPFGSVLAGIFMVALGFYLLGWHRSLLWLEFLGNYIWKFIQPLGKRFLPVKSPVHALGLGMVWGWLPCGLVYSALALAVFTSSPLYGALLMFSFGIGTLPALFAMGFFYSHLQKVTTGYLFRRASGTFVVFLGLYTIIMVAAGSSHVHALDSFGSLGGGILSEFKLAVSLLYERCLDLVR